MVALVSTLAQTCVRLGLTGNGIVEGLLGEVASLVGGVEDLVVEYGEVKGKTKTDRVGWGKFGLGNLGGSLVGVEGLVGGVLALVANGELSEVTVVVALPVDGVFLVSTAIHTCYLSWCG